MNASRLLEHFDRISEAPDAIPKLRKFILDLAVRGKLVDQSRDDESAEVLLERISSERRSRAKAKRRESEQEMAPVANDEIPFPIPNGWAATRLATIADCLDYMRKPINSSARAQRIEGKGIADLYPYFGATQQQGWIDSYIFDDELVLLGEDGVPFFDELRPKAYVVSGKTWVNNHAHVFRGIEVSARFLAHVLNTFDYAGRVAGATRSKLNQANAVDIPLALPPLAEQHRIVAKVDELMGLCDRLEVVREEQRSRYSVLARASLARIVGAATPTSLDTLFRNSYALPTVNLMASILDLAVRGKLVAQEPSDEPASAFLDRISRRQANRQGKNQGQLAKPFEIPASWIWAELGDFVESMSNGLYKPSKFYSEDGIACVRMFNIQDGRLDLSRLKRLDLTAKEVDHYRLESGDLLINRVNSRELVGKCAIVETAKEPLVFEAMNIRVRLVERRDLPAYLNLVLRTDRVREQFQRSSKQAVGQASINQPQVAGVAVPIPPPTEQRRIVAKVEELMAICDQLEQEVASGETIGQRLLDATLGQLLSTATLAAAES